MGAAPAADRQALELAIESIATSKLALEAVRAHEKDCFELSKQNATKLQLVDDNVAKVKADVAGVNTAVGNLEANLATKELKGRDNTIKAMGTVVLLLFGIVGHLLINGNPWQPKAPTPLVTTTQVGPNDNYPNTHVHPGTNQLTDPRQR